MIRNCLVDLKAFYCLCLATVVATVCDVVGIETAAFKFLLYLMTADYISGIVVAGVFHKSNKTKSGKLSSNAGFKGVLKKMGVLVAVYIGVQLELVTDVGLVADAVIAYYIGIEGISLLENLGVMGLKYPKKLRKALDVLCENEGECKK